MMDRSGRGPYESRGAERFEPDDGTRSAAFIRAGSHALLHEQAERMDALDQRSVLRGILLHRSAAYACSFRAIAFPLEWLPFDGGGSLSGDSRRAHAFFRASTSASSFGSMRKVGPAIVTM